MTEGMRAPLLPRSRRRVLFAVVVLALMLLLVAPFFVDRLARDAPTPAGGRISLAHRGMLDRPVALGGEWRLDWRAADDDDPVRSGPAPVPGNWEGFALGGGAKLPARGTGRFSLTVEGLPAGRYRLHVPILFAPYRVTLDGEPVGGFGRFAAPGRAAVTEPRGLDVPIVATGAPIRIAVTIGSGGHRDTGFADPPVLGSEPAMQRWTALAWAKALLFQAALVLLAANSLIAFLFRRQDRASLYLGAAALMAVPGTAVLSHDNLLLVAWPGMDFAAMLFLQYVCTGLAVGFFMLYTRALFPREATRWLIGPALAVLGVWLTAQLGAFAFLDTRAASRLAQAWPAVAVLAFLTLFAVVLRAAWRGREGSSVFLIGFFFFIAFTSNAMLAFSGLVPPAWLLGTDTLSLGMLMLLFSHFVVVAERWSSAIVTAERTNADLRELIDVSSAITSEMKLEALLARIVETASRILDADRSSLLLHDPRTSELWSLVAEGLAQRPIRFPDRLGIAGHVFHTGETVNVQDAYADPRFNRDVDLATGYHTNSVLTMPVVARDGRRLGVMQALNRRDGQPFTEGDTTRLGAFAAQAAIAIDNATLFTEVLASRNYNESILRSMSAGVVTLDRSGVVTTINRAAERMFEVSLDEIKGLTFRDVLHPTNPWLIPEIEAVAATGEPKLLFDLDLITARGRPLDANMSIVPLIVGGEADGLLVLVDDISEEQRLQGAMRRFMTQKVVDQVMSRQDDLLFGSACEASVLFADIRDFTSMTETLSPRATVDMLNEAFTDLFEAVAAHDGVLDKYIGDAIMAVYGAPLSTGRDPENAIGSALEMLRLIAVLNRRREARGQPPLRIGIGLSTGEVVAGTIGSPKRMDYTVIGDSVNLAARLQDLTKLYRVPLMVCPRTAAAARGLGHRVRELDLIRVRGRMRPAAIHEIVAEPLPDALLDAYARGRAAMAARDWTGAVDAFTAALAVEPEDGPSWLMLSRATRLAGQPPEEGWDGVWLDAAA